MRKMFTLLICAVLFLGAVNALAESVDLPIATIEMENGDVMKLELYPDIAPNTVANFIELANAGFYDGLIFHRVIPGFMIQGGDPTGTGMGGPGYAIKGEFAANGFENKLSHERGVISMARANDPNSARSQFFIMHADYPALDGNYAAFGRATDAQSLAVLDTIAAQPTDSTYLPLTRQVIRSISVNTFGVDYGEPQKIENQDKGA